MEHPKSRNNFGPHLLMVVPQSNVTCIPATNPFTGCRRFRWSTAKLGLRGAGLSPVHHVEFLSGKEAAVGSRGDKSQNRRRGWTDFPLDVNYSSTHRLSQGSGRCYLPQTLLLISFCLLITFCFSFIFPLLQFFPILLISQISNNNFIRFSLCIRDLNCLFVRARRKLHAIALHVRFTNFKLK